MSVKTSYIAIAAVLAVTWCGCLSDKGAALKLDQSYSNNLDSFRGPSLPIEEPAGVPVGESMGSFEMAPLDDFSFSDPSNYRLMSLEACIHAALESSPVIRELGGAILRAPDQVSTIHDPSLAFTDPRFGEAAALSAFDAVWNSQFLFQNNDRVFNNRFIGADGFLQQDLATFRSGVSKQSATGALFAFNHSIEYDRNNSPSNRFGVPKSHAYDMFFEGTFRQPLLQGAGVEFNRIAGPNNAPGVNNGVLIARINTDTTLAEFELRLRDLVSDVENAYWDLYYAYRDLETRIEARNGAYSIWESNEANEESDAAIVNQAKEQYYRFAADVENAIHGRLNEGTRTNNGSSGGTFRSNVGVRTAERRLRLITGMPLNEAQLIVPQDQPVDAEVIFDWEQSKTDALVNRPELRRQRWQVKRRELELRAACNHLKPRVDLLGTYRLRGFGENLFGERGITGTAPNFDIAPGSSAGATIVDGDLQEWEMGLDVSVPIGFRRQHAARRNAELGLSREKSILNEQERQIIYGLSNALGELKRAMNVRKANISRLEAAKAQFDAINVIYKEEGRTIDQLLEAQRRVIEAKTQFYQSQVETMLAFRSVHFEKGTLFKYHNVMMTESAWDAEAYAQLGEQASWRKKVLSYAIPGLMVGRKNGAPVASNRETLGVLVDDYMAKKDGTGAIDFTNEEPTESEVAEMIESSDSSLLAVSKMMNEESKVDDKPKPVATVPTTEIQMAKTPSVDDQVAVNPKPVKKTPNTTELIKSPIQRTESAGSDKNPKSTEFLTAGSNSSRRTLSDRSSGWVADLTPPPKADVSEKKISDTKPVRHSFGDGGVTEKPVQESAGGPKNAPTRISDRSISAPANVSSRR